MADEHNTVTLPVESTDNQTELMAAFARISEVPAARTLLDSISSEDWRAGPGDEPMEAGTCSGDPDEMDDCDEVQSKIA